LEEGSGIEDRRGTDHEIGRDGGSGDAQAFGAFVGADTDSAGNPERSLKGTDFRSRLLLFDLPGEIAGGILSEWLRRRLGHVTPQGTFAESARTRHLRILHDQRVEIGRGTATGGPNSRDTERHIRPVLAGRL